MKPVKVNGQSRVIKGQEEVAFSSAPSWHLIIVQARVKGEKQLSPQSTDDEDLVVEIDGKKFSQLASKRLIDSPAAFSGGTQHNLAKTVYFLVRLYGENHKLLLKTDRQPGVATLEKLEIYTLDFSENLTLEVGNQAEDGDRRSWITFALDDLAITSFDVVLSLKRRLLDSDDVKVVIDGNVQRSYRDNLRKLWYFVASVFQGETQSATFTPNLPQGLHYIEFWADRMPVLNIIKFDFGTKPGIPKRIPTANDPAWTGNFNDDTNEMLLARLILGEAERQPKEAKIGVGFTVLNRLKKKRSNWGHSVKEIILKGRQYDGMWNQNTYDKVRDPFSDSSATRKREWTESYEVAKGILSSNLNDPTNGATNFHSYPKNEPFPSWATKKTFKIKIGSIYFYELEG